MLTSADEALQSIARKIGLPNLRFDTDRICVLDVGDTLTLEIEDKASDATVRFNAAIGYAGDFGSTALRLLLSANFNGDGTGKAALAINPASGDLVLGQVLDPRHHTADSLHAELELFVRRALFWQDRAQTLPADVEVDAVPDTDETINFRL